MTHPTRSPVPRSCLIVSLPFTACSRNVSKKVTVPGRPVSLSLHRPGVAKAACAVWSAGPISAGHLGRRHGNARSPPIAALSLAVTGRGIRRFGRGLDHRRGDNPGSLYRVAPTAESRWLVLVQCLRTARDASDGSVHPRTVAAPRLPPSNRHWNGHPWSEYLPDRTLERLGAQSAVATKWFSNRTPFLTSRLIRQQRREGNHTTLGGLHSDRRPRSRPVAKLDGRLCDRRRSNAVPRIARAQARNQRTGRSARSVCPHTAVRQGDAAATHRPLLAQRPRTMP